MMVFAGLWNDKKAHLYNDIYTIFPAFNKFLRVKSWQGN
jgi:hypothetical protein